MLRWFFIPDIEACVGFIRTIFQNDDVVILSGYDALYIVTRSLDWPDENRNNRKNEAHAVPLYNICLRRYCFAFVFECVVYCFHLYIILDSS